MKNISEEKKPERKEFLFTASYAVGAVGVVAVVTLLQLVTFLKTWKNKKKYTVKMLV